MAHTIFSDINPRYGKSPKGELLRDEDAINASIENILGTDKGERLFLPGFGSDIGNLIFEQMTEETATDILFTMIDAIEDWEPRVQVIRESSNVIPDYDNNFYRVTLAYEILLSGDVSSFNRILERPTV